MALIHTFKKIGGVVSDKKFYIPASIIALILIFIASYFVITDSSKRNAEATLAKDFSDGRFEDAVKDGQAILKKTPKDLPAIKITAKSYMRLAQLGVVDKTIDSELAVNLLYIAIKDNPKDAELASLLGYAFHVKNSDAPAKFYAQKALSETKDTDPIAWLVLAYTDEKTASSSKTNFEYKQALKYAPENLEVLVNQIKISLHDQRTKEAITAAKQLATSATLKDAYIQSLAHQALGLAYFNLDTASSRSLAATEFVAALHINPSLIPAAAGYGLLLTQRLYEKPVSDMKAAANELLTRGNIIVSADQNYVYGYALLAEAYKMKSDKINYAKYAALTVQKANDDMYISAQEKAKLIATYGVKTTPLKK